MHSQTACASSHFLLLWWGILLQLRSDWVVNIAQSRKHHTRAEHAVLLCTYGRRLGFTGKPILRPPDPKEGDVNGGLFMPSHVPNESGMLSFIPPPIPYGLFKKSSRLPSAASAY